MMEWRGTTVHRRCPLTRIAALLSLTVMAASSARASAETVPFMRLEFETLADREDRFQPSFALMAGASASDGALGGFAFAWVGERHAEAYAGFSLAFPAGPGRLWTAYGLGIEQSRKPAEDRNPIRLAFLASYDAPKHLFWLQTELGATNKVFVEPYAYARWAWKATAEFDLGVMARRHAGIGPRLDFWLHRPGLGLWLAPLYDPESGGFAFMAAFSSGY